VLRRFRRYTSARSPFVPIAARISAYRIRRNRNEPSLTCNASAGADHYTGMGTTTTLVTRRPRRRLLRRFLISMGWAAIVVIIGAGYWLQPWKLLTNTTVDAAAPSVGGSGAPVVVTRCTFISYEHHTTGVAKLLRLADGSAVVRLENLVTSEGPKVRVVLTDAPVIAGSDGFHVFRNGRYADLGALKGNRGNANYAVPAGVDLAGLNSVSGCCDRFNVSFGAGWLAPPATPAAR
jgi:hypothetical protein